MMNCWLKCYFFVLMLCFALVGCAQDNPYALIPPNYDDLVGKNFSDSIYMGRRVFKKVRETELIEELERRRSDGCILIFGVRKKDDIIEYWRVDSGPGTCYTRSKPINV